jgi:hypothetical protein
MRFNGAEYNNIERGEAETNMLENGMSRVLVLANRKTVK